MTEQLRYDGKVVIVTGAGNGLGRAYALMFGARGAKVVVNDLGGDIHGGGSHGDGKRSSAAADKVVEEIKALGGEAVANYDSVTDGAKVVQTALDAFGTVDIVINNAGILRDVSFQKMTQADWDIILNVHLNGTFSVSHAAWPIMRDKGYGRIVMTTSAAGIYGNFGQANYSAAKMGIFGLASTLAEEGRAKNVLVNTIAPIAASRLTETVLPPDLLEKLNPDYIAPLVGWLAHETCEETKGLFEVGAGYVAKLRWERTRGYAFGAGKMFGPEEVAAKWSKVTDFADAEHPTVTNDTLTAVMTALNSKKRGGNEFIDLDEAISQPPIEMETSYDERDLSLYALGVGAGADPLDASDLRLIHERGDKFFPLPTYGVMPALNGFMKMMQQGKQPAGMNIGFDRVLHGEQYTEIKRPLPPHATLTHKAKLRDAYDKGKDAIGIVDIHSFDETGEEIAYNEISFFLRGAGGWGGDRGPSGEINVPPQREPDAVIEEKVGESQALLYRLSGDWNPLHVDPDFARNFGFERPILHGLCTYGYVGRHVIKAFLDNDPRRFKSLKVRFAKSVYPGDTLVTRMWKESDLRIVFETTVKERNEVVIKAAAVELYAEIPAAKAKVTAAATATAVAVQDERLLPEDVFAVVAKFVAANPDLVEKTKTTFQFNLTNPESNWILDLKNGQGEVRQGTLDKPDVTLSTDQNLLETVVTAPTADVQKLFFGGQLKIGGNMMASSKLSALQAIPKAQYDAAKAKRLGGAAPATAAAPAPADAAPKAPKVSKAGEIFAALGKKLSENVKLAAGAQGAQLQFNVREPASTWSVDLSGAAAKVEASAAAKPNVVFGIDDADLVALVKGEAQAQHLYQQGKLRVDGEARFAQQLAFLDKLI